MRQRAGKYLIRDAASLLKPSYVRISRRCLSSSNRDGSSPESPLIYPEAPTSQHSSLSSFLAYSKRSGLDAKSTVYVGTHYEYSVAATLAKYGFFLRRVGGASDLGIDLLGTWTPSSSTDAPTMKVLVQCKAGAQKVGPQHVRELEGAFVGAPAGWRGSGVLALLVSERDATKGVRESIGRSRWPMGYVCCTKDGLVRQMLWNRRAEDEGLDGYGVTAKRFEGREEAELVLVRNGKILPLLEVARG